MNKHTIWAWAIKNSICVLCWAALAVFFGKWWIALFGVLFLSEVKTGYKNYQICDKCGKHSPYADSREESLTKARAAGWKHIEEGNRDYCPDCWNGYTK